MSRDLWLLSARATYQQWYLKVVTIKATHDDVKIMSFFRGWDSYEVIGFRFYIRIVLDFVMSSAKHKRFFFLFFFFVLCIHIYISPLDSGDIAIVKWTYDNCDVVRDESFALRYFFFLCCFFFR